MNGIINRDREGTHNRTLTMEWAMENDMVATSSCFRKEKSKLVTFRKKEPKYRI